MFDETRRKRERAGTRAPALREALRREGVLRPYCHLKLQKILKHPKASGDLVDDEQVERRFAEQMALLFETGGLPAMAGRVWAALLVTEGPHLSARELGDRLGVSAGSVSTANRFLLRLGLIERVWVPGERRDYYAARPGAIADLVRLRLDRLVATEQLAAEALEQFGERPHARSRLTEIHDVYSWYARELPALHERFLAERALPREREHQ